MLALSIRQPFAELILRGIKRVEYRSRPTRIIGERFWIYASKTATERRSDEATKGGIWSEDLSIDGELPAWMVELAEQVKLIPPGLELPRGVIVGSAVIERVEEIATERRSDEATEGPEDSLSFPSSLRRSVATSLFEWHLTNIERVVELRKPTRRPQPVWFRPF